MVGEAAESEDASSWGDAQSDIVCDRTGWAEFDVQSLFTFRAPCSLKGGAEKGIDSHVGSYTGDGMRLGYDYGHYSSPLTEWSSKSGYQVASVVVDTRSAYIVTASDPAAPDGLTLLFGLHVPKVDESGARLTFDGQCDTTERLGVGVDILNSIDFP